MKNIHIETKTIDMDDMVEIRGMMTDNKLRPSARTPEYTGPTSGYTRVKFWVYPSIVVHVTKQEYVQMTPAEIGKLLGENISKAIHELYDYSKIGGTK